MRASDELEEVLQALFCLTEEKSGPFARDEVLNRARTGAEPLDVAVKSGLVVEGPDGLSLSERGRSDATIIVRRHRLAERLLHDVLRVADPATESVACKFEHILEDEVTESICTLLGHPNVCPHGKPIPRGACCANGQTNAPAVIRRLSDIGAGDCGVVAYVYASDDRRIDRLASFGLVPGTELHLHQTWPSVVVEFGETHLALDRETADEIFVRVVPGEGGGAGRRRRFRRGGRE